MKSFNFSTVQDILLNILKNSVHQSKRKSLGRKIDENLKTDIMKIELMKIGQINRNR